MNAVAAVRQSVAAGDDVNFEVAFAAQKDASEIAFLEGVIRTTMGATTDDRTRRELRVKLDALNTMRTATVSVPSSIPTTF